MTFDSFDITILIMAAIAFMGGLYIQYFILPKYDKPKTKTQTPSYL